MGIRENYLKKPLPTPFNPSIVSKHTTKSPPRVLSLRISSPLKAFKAAKASSAEKLILRNTKIRDS